MYASKLMSKQNASCVTQPRLHVAAVMELNVEWTLRASKQLADIFKDAKIFVSLTHPC